MLVEITLKKAFLTFHFIYSTFIFPLLMPWSLLTQTNRQGHSLGKKPLKILYSKNMANFEMLCKIIYSSIRQM